MMNILGISAYYHDSAACLLRNGHVVAASQEERFTRKKNDASFPVHAIESCLNVGGLNKNDIDAVVFYEKPFRHFERLIETSFAYAPRGLRQFLAAMPVWLKQKLWIKENLHKQLPGVKEILFTEHHQSHAAAAFYPSPFEQAAVITVDGVGEWTTASFGVGDGSSLELRNEIHFPHSLGLLYSAFTYYLGFKVNSGEYKVMGLAPYGEPRFVQEIYEHLIDLKEDGSFRLNLDYFAYCTGLRMTNDRFHSLFGGPPRQPEAALTQREMDLARSVQEVVEEVMLRMANFAYRESGLKSLCLAGGVALNCVANGRIMREGPFDDIWVQPAAGDSGGALGAALYAWHHHFDKERRVEKGTDAMSAALLGPEYTADQIRAVLDEEGAVYTEHSSEVLIEQTARMISENQVIGWFQGRMEYGPRALGNRSILADARSPQMQRQVNLKVKFREGFRPFAPVVLEDKVQQWFELDRKSPYMLFVAPVNSGQLRKLNSDEMHASGLGKLAVVRSTIPAVTHVDNSARIQTVSKDENPLFHQLLTSFDALTGCPVLVNTSFNVRGEPIVCSPFDALRCFLSTDIDALAIGPFLLSKKEQPDTLLAKYADRAIAPD